jgi:hypothetical protein
MTRPAFESRYLQPPNHPQTKRPLAHTPLDGAASYRPVSVTYWLSEIRHLAVLTSNFRDLSEPVSAYSITSSARARSVCGTVRPSAFAVLRLITSSNVVGCWTGRSAGLEPLRILPA